MLLSSLAAAGRPEVMFKTLRVDPAGCSYFYPSSKRSSTSTNTGTSTPEYRQKVANFGPVFRTFTKVSQVIPGFTASPQPLCSSSSTPFCPTQTEVPHIA